jgi:hypothetical protein
MAGSKLLVTPTIKRGTKGRLINDNLERVRMEAVVACFKVLSPHLLRKQLGLPLVELLFCFLFFVPTVFEKP